VRDGRAKTLRLHEHAHKLARGFEIHSLCHAAPGIQAQLSGTLLTTDDLELLSRSLTYVTWSARSTDGKPHDVSAYFSAGGDLAVNTLDQKVVAKREKAGDLTALVIGSEEQPVLRSKGDDHRIDWGYLYLTAPQQASAVIGDDAALAEAFAKEGKLADKDDDRFPRAVRDGKPTAAVVVDLGKVNDAPVSKYAMVAYDDLFSIQYMKKNLRPYWRRRLSPGWCKT